MNLKFAFLGVARMHPAFDRSWQLFFTLAFSVAVCAARSAPGFSWCVS
jgi:hypothetical protein